MAKAQATPTGPAVVAIGNPGASMPSTPNKSVPAPTVAVPTNVKKWLWLAMVVAVIAGTIALIASVAHSPGRKQSIAPQSVSRSEVPLENMPPKTLRMPANGNSRPINPTAGYKVAFDGNGFTTYCGGYPDSQYEGIVGDPVRPCRDGATSYYVHDTSGNENEVTWHYVRP